MDQNQENVVPQPIPKAKKRKSDPDVWRRNRIKLAKLNGTAHFGYKNERVEAKKLNPDQDCNCQPKCKDKFSLDEKQSAYDSYYGSNSNTEKVIYLRSCINKVGSKNKFFLKVSGSMVSVCMKYFLAIFNIKYSKLERKVLNWDSNPTDMRGKHFNQKKVAPAVMNKIRSYIMKLDGKESHYSRNNNPHRLYLESNLTAAKLYRSFINENPELSPFAVQNEAEMTNQHVHRVKPWLFENILNYEFNLGFSFPRSDICEKCEKNVVTMKALTRNPLANNELVQLKLSQEEHLKDAEGFYNSMKTERLATLPDTTVCLNFDFQKNLPLPVTSTSSEFYSRQLWLINFGLHDLRSGQSTMYLYSETFAHKGANEVISCLNHYINTQLAPNTRNLILYCDNCYGQNKNRFLLAYLNSLYQKFESVEIHFPIPGHTRMTIDRDFGQIEKLKRSYYKFSTPSDYVRLIKEARPNNPFHIVYVEQCLTDDLGSDGTDICPVHDFKTGLAPFLKTSVGVGQIRSFRVLQDGKVICRKQTTGAFEGEFKYLKDGFTADSLMPGVNAVKAAYDDYVGVSAAKAKDVESLLQFVDVSPTCVFYSTMYPLNGINRPDWTSNSQLMNHGIYDDDEEDE